MCILSVYTFVKVVSYYDLSVLSMSVMGFQKKKLGWVGGVNSIQFFLILFNFAKPLNTVSPFETISTSSWAGLQRNLSVMSVVI